MAHRSILAIGASAGGLTPVREILSRLPADLPASVFLVQHQASEPTGLLVEIHARSGAFAVKWAEDGEPIRPGVVYVAPADRHLVLHPGQVRVFFGARESRARPSIDVLFRSAATAYGSQTVGIVLSGMLDDGALGLHAIKSCGGVAIVMDPAFADAPEMPRAALREVEVDHVLAAKEIGLLIPQLVEQSVEPVEVPDDIRMEDQIAQEAMVRATAPTAAAGDERNMIACPDCGGALGWRETSGRGLYRCRLGHAYGPTSLLNAQQDQLEQAVWVAMRILSDRKRVLHRMAEDYQASNRPSLAGSMSDRASELDEEYRTLHNLLITLRDPPSLSDAERQSGVAAPH